MAEIFSWCGLPVITGVLVYQFPEPSGQPAWTGTAGPQASRAWGSQRATSTTHRLHTHHHLPVVSSLTFLTPKLLVTTDLYNNAQI